MDIRELNYFLAVAREQNLTKAAALLYVTQPSLTRQIQNLEREIGAPLFLRKNKKMVLTDTGLLLKKRAEEIVSLFEKTQAELVQPNQEIGGDIYIGGGETASFSCVVAAMNEMRTSYPNVRFHLFSGNTDEVCERLDKGLVDFSVLVEPCDLSKYEFLRLPLSDTWGLLMRKDSPLAQKEVITARDFIGIPLITSRHIINGKNGELEAILANAQIVATYNLIYNASLLVKSGIGYALTLDGLINTADSELCFVPLEPKTVSFIDFAWKKNQVFQTASKYFLQTLQKHLIHYNEA